MKSMWKKIWARKRLVYIGVAVIAVVGLWKFFSGGEEPVETVAATRGEFVRQVSVSGKVVAEQEANLSFSETGRVEALNVKVGDKVSAGQTLATLGVNVLLSDLRTARSDLDQTQKEQDALVSSAYRTLLSDDLEAVPTSASFTATAPTITGLYDGPGGTYRIRIEQKPNLGDYELRVLGLENTAPTTILDDEPTQLGTRGLFVSFSDAQSSYSGTTWTVAIPNVKSSSYLSNYNAYQEALRTRDKAIAAAEAQIDEIQTEIADRTLRAPFSGTITVVDTDVGNVAAVNDPVIKIISEGSLQIESYVPEINLSLVQPGASSTVTLDAYGDDTPFDATVVSVDPAETVRDGVSTYRAVLEFTNPDDPRIRSGMTANVVIVADKRENILSIPRGAVYTRDGQSYVKVQEGENIVERAVETGSISSVGAIEIKSGLSEGEHVVVPTTN